MFSCSSFEFLLSIVVTIALASSKPYNASAKTVVPANSQTGQTFVINNNCGPASADGQMMADIKAKVDYIATQFDKGSACSDGWVLHGKSCYLVIDIPTLDGNAARRNCQKLGGDLPKITSATENQFIYDLINGQKKTSRRGAWLGMKRRADKKFYWVDGTPLTTGYTAWSPGEPNSESDECAIIFGQADHRRRKWNDLPCTLNDVEISSAPVVLCQKRSK